MTQQPIDRRHMLSLTGLAVGAGLTAVAADPAAAAAPQPSEAAPFGFCLNTSTIRGQGLTLVEEIDIASKVGYTAMEPWVREVDEYVQAGGTLDDLRKRFADSGLSIESMIAFGEWIVDDDARRAKGLAESQRAMEIAARIGGKRLAAPPAGATEVADFDLWKAAERYRVLCEMGAKSGVVAELEIWGFSRTLSRLSEALYVAVECGHPQACLLPDVYHLYKGGSDFGGLRFVQGGVIPVLHMNDYPAQPARADIKDEHRIFPGDGVAPLPQILRDLRASGFRGYLSLELFNRGYWKQDATAVARTGLEKMRAAVQQSLS